MLALSTNRARRFANLKEVPTTRVTQSVSGCLEEDRAENEGHIMLLPSESLPQLWRGLLVPFEKEGWWPDVQILKDGGLGIYIRLMAGLSSMRERGFAIGDMSAHQKGDKVLFHWSSFGGAFSNRAWIVEAELDATLLQQGQIEVEWASISVYGSRGGLTVFEGGPVMAILEERLPEVLATCGARLLLKKTVWDTPYEFHTEIDHPLPEGWGEDLLTDKETEYFPYEQPVEAWSMPDGRVVLIDDSYWGQGSISGPVEARAQLITIAISRLLEA